MKRLYNSILIVVVMMAMSINVQAQKQGGRLDWQQKIKSEKIAFLTSAMNLSPEEAQIFWPVYNKAEAEKGIAMKAIRQSFKDLADAEKAGKSGKEISSLTKIYLEACSKPQAIDAKFAREYEKILPSEKVAKLFIAEEEFRMMQVRRLNEFRRGSEQKR